VIVSLRINFYICVCEKGNITIVCGNPDFFL